MYLHTQTDNSHNTHTQTHKHTDAQTHTHTHILTCGIFQLSLISATGIVATEHPQHRREIYVG